MLAYLLLITAVFVLFMYITYDVFAEIEKQEREGNNNDND